MSFESVDSVVLGFKDIFKRKPQSALVLYFTHSLGEVEGPCFIHVVESFINEVGDN